MADRHNTPTQQASNPQEGRRLADWFRQWRRPVGQWLARRSTAPPADIEDLAQEVFLRLLRYSDDVAVTNPQGYLFRIAANVASEWQDRARQRNPHDDSWLAELQIEPDAEPQNEAARTVVQRCVREAVRELPARHRQVLILHIEHDLTCAQIAQQLGLTYRSVQRDLARAYSRLRSQLHPDDFSSKSER